MDAAQRGGRMAYVRSSEKTPSSRSRRSFAIAWLILAAIASAACGYRFQQQARLPGGAQRLYVDIFENRTNQAGLETTVTNAVVFEFIKRGETDIVKEASQAELVMKGIIRSVEIRTVATRNKDAAGERQVTLTLDVRLVQPDGKTAWSANGLMDGEAYVVTSDKFLNDDRQRATLALAATRIAERIYNRFTDDF
jgi:outer membrane lipopolysaccharide assembly protein LptE/RlpB